MVPTVGGVDATTGGAVLTGGGGTGSMTGAASTIAAVDGATGATVAGGGKVVGLVRDRGRGVPPATIGATVVVGPMTGVGRAGSGKAPPCAGAAVVGGGIAVPGVIVAASP